MSKEAKELKNLLIDMMGSNNNIIPVQVISVNKNNATCNVHYNDLEFGEIRLQAIIGTNIKGLKLYPKIGSIILVQKIGKHGQYIVIGFSEIEEYEITIEQVTFKINNNGITMSKNNDNLKNAIQLIIEAVQQIVVTQGTSPNYAKLSQATSKINNILQ